MRRGPTGVPVKVVLFCGGQGLRLREYPRPIPKPMVPIGTRPILWHVMRYYAHFGHKDFVLCLGYRAEVIKDYFLRYNEAISNDFVLSRGRAVVELLQHATSRTGGSRSSTPDCMANIGERLRAVRHHLEDEEMFLANYGDALTDAPLDTLIEDFERATRWRRSSPSDRRYSFHLVDTDEDGDGPGIQHVQDSDMRINGGYFIFRREIFDYIREGEELVEEPFLRLIGRGKLHGLSATTGSGPRWTRSRTSRNATPSGTRGSPVGRLAQGRRGTLSADTGAAGHGDPAAVHRRAPGRHRDRRRRDHRRARC